MKEFKINIQGSEIIIFQDDDGCFIKPKIVVELEKQGTATKPAHEPICMARKPLSEKTVAENCLKWGTGGLNIDESRVETSDILSIGSNNHKNATVFQTENKLDSNGQNILGRFPANLIHDNSEEVRECFPETKPQADNRHKGEERSTKFGQIKSNTVNQWYADNSGNASRFFKSIIYQAKASKSERNRGCEGLEEKAVAWGNQAKAELKRGNMDFKAGGDATKHNKVEMRINNHPTIKPIALMQYLIKMITPKGGTVLDPFMGSGSTGIAAVRNGFSFIGIDMTAEYVEIANARINHEKKLNRLFEEV